MNSKESQLNKLWIANEIIFFVSPQYLCSIFHVLELNIYPSNGNEI